jgi:hypothetical protein
VRPRPARAADVVATASGPLARALLLQPGMPPHTTRPGRDDDVTDYEQLRNHLARPQLEHPAARQQPVEPPPAAPRIEPAGSVSVMEWLLAVGHAVARRLRRTPCSAMARLHPPE